MNATWSIIVHGGAGKEARPDERIVRERVLRQAANAGAAIMREGGSALDAVIAAVQMLEDDPHFNAGRGSVLNADGQVEMDAAIVAAELATSKRTQAATTHPPPTSVARWHRGRYEMRAGGVAAVGRVYNPVLLARAVADLTAHVLMFGAGAERLAKQAGLRLCRREELITERARNRFANLPNRQSHRVTAPSSGHDHETVGAVARDSKKQFAAATSTGGITGKLAGRVGDSAIIGAGAFAEPEGAAAATGEGEAIINLGLCREAVRRLRKVSAQSAADEAVAVLRQMTTAQGGIIVVDRLGRLGYAHNSEAMEVAMCSSAIDDGAPNYRLLRSDTLGAPRSANNRRG